MIRLLARISSPLRPVRQIVALIGRRALRLNSREMVPRLRPNFRVISRDDIFWALNTDKRSRSSSLRCSYVLGISALW